MVFLGEGNGEREKMQHDGAQSVSTALCLLVYSPRAFWGDGEAHVQPAAEGTRKGPDTAEFAAQAGEGWLC